MSEELDGNSQFYLCIRDICHYLDGATELKSDNKALLVISDMNFDGIGDDMSKTRPLKDKSHAPVDFTTMKQVSIVFFYVRFIKPGLETQFHFR